MLKQYIDDYLEKIGGIDNLVLYTDEELDEYDKNSTESLLSLLEEFRRRNK